MNGYEMQPLILQEWQKKPELKGATIQKVELVHKNGKLYTGFVDATVGGQRQRFALEVVLDGELMLSWELKLLEGQQRRVTTRSCEFPHAGGSAHRPGET